MRKIPVGVLLYVDGLAKVDFSCPDCHKFYHEVVVGGIGAPKKCAYWHDEVCCNTDSEKIADFTNKDFSCNCHEFKGSESNA